MPFKCLNMPVCPNKRTQLYIVGCIRSLMIFIHIYSMFIIVPMRLGVNNHSVKIQTKRSMLDLPQRPFVFTCNYKSIFLCFLRFSINLLKWEEEKFSLSRLCFTDPYENYGIGKRFLELACSGAEIFEFFACPNMGIGHAKNSNISAPEHASSKNSFHTRRTQSW